MNQELATIYLNDEAAETLGKHAKAQGLHFEAARSADNCTWQIRVSHHLVHVLRDYCLEGEDLSQAIIRVARYGLGR